MSKRRIAVKPVEPLVLEFADGSIKEAAFTNEAIIYLTESFGDLSRLVEDEMTRPVELASKILYAGMKVMDNQVSLDEAKAIVIGGGMPLMLEIFNSMADSFGAVDPEELKKTLAPLVTKMLSQKK